MKDLQKKIDKLDPKVALDVRNVLTSVDNLGGKAYSWEIRHELGLRGARITEWYFSERLGNAFYVMEKHKIMERDDSGQYQIIN